MIGKKKFEIKIINIIFLLFAGIVNATGVILMLTPAKVIDGGFSGTSILLSLFTPISVAIYLILINLPFFIFGYKKLGLQFIIYSLIAILSYSITSYFYQYIYELDKIVFDLMKKDMLLACIFGGIISGVGSGMTIRFGGAIDGVEVMAVLFAKRIGITVGQFVMAYNLIIYTVAVILYKDLAIGMYSIISYAIGLKIVDFIVDGFDKGKAFTIVTDKGEIVAKEISNIMNQGVTIIESKGYYSNQEKKMLYCVVNRFEVTKLKKIVSGIDKGAFIAINDISEVVGNKTSFKFKGVSDPKIYTAKLDKPSDNKSTSSNINKNNVIRHKIINKKNTEEKAIVSQNIIDDKIVDSQSLQIDTTAKDKK